VQDVPLELEVLDVKVGKFAHPEAAEGEHVDDRAVAGRLLHHLEETVHLLLGQVPGEALGAAGRLELVGDREPVAAEEAGEAADGGVDRVLGVVPLEHEILPERLEVMERDLVERLLSELQEHSGDVAVLLHRTGTSFLRLEHTLEPADQLEDVETGRP